MLRRHWSARRCGHKSKEMCRSASCPAFHNRKAHAGLGAGFPSAISRHSAFGGRWAATTAATSQMQGRRQSRQMISHCAGCTNTPFTLLCVHEYMLSVSIQISLIIGFSTEGNRQLSFLPRERVRHAPRPCILLWTLEQAGMQWLQTLRFPAARRPRRSKSNGPMKPVPLAWIVIRCFDTVFSPRALRHGARIGKDEPWY
jgi:hypothetical protein